MRSQKSSFSTRYQRLSLAFVTLLTLASQLHSAERWTTSRLHGSPEPPRPLVAAPAYPGLLSKEILELVFDASTRRWFALERPGRLISWLGQNEAVTEPDVVGNLKELHPDLDYFYGLAFHPQYASNRQVFLCYTCGPGKPDGTKVSRFTMKSANPPVLDPASEELLLTWPSGGHNGANIQFGPDGMLYISSGDGTVPAPPDTLNTGQDISDLLSSILRIDVDHRDPGLAYRIPPDNPFIGKMVDTADHQQKPSRAEVWAYGLRNPWKMSFDRATGRLWCGDVGWEIWEMIHLIQRGGNYGWSAMEASQPIRTDAPKAPSPILPPVIAHTHDEAASITGGFVYHGKSLPHLRDAYVYGDYETGKIWALWHDGKQVTRHEEIADTAIKIVTFGQDADGEILVGHWGNPSTLHRLVPNPQAASGTTFPRRLSETGLFAETAKQQPSPGVHPFAIHAPMWRDGATGHRFIGMPQGSVATQVWTDKATQKIRSKVTWPAETVLAKTLSMQLAEDRPESTIKVETQVLHFDGEAWNAYSYRWNEQGTDAELVEASGTERTLDLAGSRFPGGKHRYTYRFASRAECLRCHNAWSGFVLGFQPPQLIQGNALVEAGLIDANYLKQSASTLVNPAASSETEEARARSWLHANCAHCHRENGGGSAPLIVNVELANSELRALHEAPTRGDLGIAESRVIAPGNPWKSLLLHRIATTSAGHMPAIGSREPDPQALQLLAGWIRSLQPEIPLPASPPTAPVTPESALAWLCSPHRGEPSPALLEAARTSPNPQVRGLLESLLPDDQRIATLGVVVDEPRLLAMKGDATRGEQLLSPTGKAATCLACHLVKGSGRGLGPDLSGLGARSQPNQILESILHPSRVIAPGFAAVSVELKDGSPHMGFVASEDSNQITLKTIAGQSLNLPRSQIQSLKPLPASLMPEGLLQSFTAQEAADIIAYLSSLK